jgi:hypothetical protein
MYGFEIFLGHLLDSLLFVENSYFHKEATFTAKLSESARERLRACELNSSS